MWRIDEIAWIKWLVLILEPVYTPKKITLWPEKSEPDQQQQQQPQTLQTPTQKHSKHQWKRIKQFLQNSQNSTSRCSLPLMASSKFSSFSTRTPSSTSISARTAATATVASTNSRNFIMMMISGFGAENKRIAPKRARNNSNNNGTTTKWRLGLVRRWGGPKRRLQSRRCCWKEMRWVDKCRLLSKYKWTASNGVREVLLCCRLCGRRALLCAESVWVNIGYLTV